MFGAKRVGMLATMKRKAFVIPAIHTFPQLALPDLKCGTRFSGTGTVFPVLGLRPIWSALMRNGHACNSA